MKVSKQIITHEPMDITIDKITLLSAEEYERCKEHIPAVNYWWWLRTPGNYSFGAALVYDDGYVSRDVDYVGYDYVSVRPVVVVRLNPESPNLQIGDKLDFAGYTWTMIDANMALCDSVVGQTSFRKDSDAPDANDYEKSDVRKWLEQWAKEKGIEVG